MKKFIFLLILLITSEAYSQVDYVELYLKNKISLYSISQEFSSKSKYRELYEILSRILEKTNSFEVLIEKIKIGFGLGIDVNKELLMAFSNNLIENYKYLPIFQSKNLVSNFSEFLIREKETNQTVIYQFSKLCLTYNYIEPLVNLATNTSITNEEVISQLVSKLFSFNMFSNVVKIYDKYKGIISFDTEDLITIGRSMANIGDERSITLLEQDIPYFLPYRVEALVKLGYIDEAVNEIKTYGINARSALWAFTALLNKEEYNLCQTSLIYINDINLRSYLSIILNFLTKNDIIETERKLKELLKKRDVNLSIKNQIAIILWIINTSENIKEMKKEIIFSYNYLNGIKTSNFYSERVLEKIRNFR
ncbi:MAG: hypothetical protein ACP5QP_03995 [Brevinematia bacterium]